MGLETNLCSKATWQCKEVGRALIQNNYPRRMQMALKGGVRYKYWQNPKWSWVWPLYADTELNLGTRVLGEVKMSSFYYSAQLSWWHGLPWWLRLWRICLQCRRRRFDPWSGRSPGEGNGNPLQYSCLENSIEEPGRLWSMESQRIGHGWATDTIILASKGGHRGLVTSKSCAATWRGRC